MRLQITITNMTWFIPSLFHVNIYIYIGQVYSRSSMILPHQLLVSIQSIFFIEGTNSAEKYCDEKPKTQSFASGATITFVSDESNARKGFIASYITSGYHLHLNQNNSLHNLSHLLKFIWTQKMIDKQNYKVYNCF